MSFLIAVGLTVFLSPLLIPVVLRLLIRVFGTYLKQKTKGRKELLLSRAVDTEQNASHSSKDIVGDDADWEKVDRNLTASAPNGASYDGSWHGIVGFFHPFW